MIIAANFKTNHTRKSTETYLSALENFLNANEVAQDVIVFPPATALMEGTERITIGAQNAWTVTSGAFTGEIGTEQLDEFGVKTVLIGHSERRHILGETQDVIAEKFEFFKAKGYRIVYCIGEPLEIRDEGSEALMQYLDTQFEGIDAEYEHLVVAYEPVWAIGTGRVPELDDIELIHGALAKRVEAPLLYGGSVKAGNAASILALPSVDGALVGSGALAVDDFCEMISIAEKAEKE